MKVAVRADASAEMGTGHLKRCLSLAEALVAVGAEPCFVIRRHDGVAEKIMTTVEYPVLWLPTVQACTPLEADMVRHAGWSQANWQTDALEMAAALEGQAPRWVIVDQYAFDARWHDAVRAKLGCSILAIDDLGDRLLSADLVLDANAAASHSEKYAGLITPGTRMLAGPRFAPLSSAYRDASHYVFSPEVRSIGVFTGGIDAGGVSASVLQALRDDAHFQGAVEIVSTSSNTRLAALERICAMDGRATLSIDLPDLSAFYARHDLQIGAGGTSSYERCCIGAPTVAIVLAANQLAVVPALIQLGVVAGANVPTTDAGDLLPGLPPLGAVVRQLLDDPVQRQILSQNASRYVDGRGAERVALVMAANRLAVRVARVTDAAMLHAWRNDPVTRSVSINKTDISYEHHVRWLARVLGSADHYLFVATVGELPVGAVRFDRNDSGAWEISLYMDPGLHGLGLGTRMLLAGEAAVATILGEAVDFIAQIVPGNEASTRMFVRAGYQGTAERLRKVHRREGAK